MASAKDRLWKWALLGVIAVALAVGLYLSLVQSTAHIPVYTGEHKLAGADLKYYRVVIDRVGRGENYYDVAREQLPEWGFPIGSPFNWRLPTYAYLLGVLPGPGAIQAVAALIGLAGLVLAGLAEFSSLSRAADPAASPNPLPAFGTILLLIGVAAWPLSGDAYLAQEVWAGMLILLSVGAAGCAADHPRWRIVSVAAGLLALAFRELVLPYCLIAGGIALWQGRRREAVAWLVGVVLFFGYLAWHMSQVHARLAPEERADSLGIPGWVHFGGLNFDIMCTRMNAFLISMPGWIVFLYLAMGVIGLFGWRSEQGALLALTTISYLASFAVIGESKNFNWGLMFAPLLPFGVVRAPGVIRCVIGAALPTPEAASSDIEGESVKDSTP
jgi:hypothetical protein